MQSYTRANHLKKNSSGSRKGVLWGIVEEEDLDGVKVVDTPVRFERRPFKKSVVVRGYIKY